MTFLLVTSHGEPVREHAAVETAVRALRERGHGAVVRLPDFAAIAVAIPGETVTYERLEARGKAIARLARLFRGGVQ